MVSSLPVLKLRAGVHLKAGLGEGLGVFSCVAALGAAAPGLTRTRCTCLSEKFRPGQYVYITEGSYALFWGGVSDFVKFQF
jgi:hypothetical protein